MKNFLAWVALLLMGGISSAQQSSRGRIVTVIKNTEQSALDNVTVELRRAGDSALIRTTLSDKDGRAEFENVRDGSYCLKALMVNYGSFFTSTVSIGPDRLLVEIPTIVLEKMAVWPGTVTVQIPINLSSSDYYRITVSAPVRINKWWNMINNGNFFYNHFNGKLGSTTLSNGKPVLDIRTTNTFSFGKGWVAELSGNFNSGGRYGFMELDPQWGIGAGVQKTVMKGKGTVRFNITDIFWTNLPEAVITYNNYIEKWHAFRETRVANLTFAYRFGNNKVQAARRRTTASEDERQRAQ